MVSRLKMLRQDESLLPAFIALASASLYLSAGNSVQGIWSNTSSQLVAANAGS